MYCFLIYSFQFVFISNLSTCVYWLGDSNGVMESKILSDLGVNITILGEWSFIQPEPDSSECYSINLKMLNNMKHWVSLTTTYSTLRDCCQNQILECLQHRSDNETAQKFVTRVLKTCKNFQGKVSQVICRNNLTNKSKIVNRLKIVSAHIHPGKIVTIGCDNESEEPFKTPDGVFLFHGPNDIVSVNIDTGIVSSISPTFNSLTQSYR
ncbi:hypothetical protein HZS_2093 [Henneguya salminicola]|nr:hypothetical protein HZS_2093 [Henneguya salminicola]